MVSPKLIQNLIRFGLQKLLVGAIGVIQVGECQPSKHEALSSNSSTTKKEKKKRRKERRKKKNF
jgi:hypothetical protein